MNDQAGIPVSAEAERSVLGALLLSQKAVADVGDMLNAADFHNPHHRTLYQAINRLFDAEEPVDVITVTDELIRSNALNGALNTAFIHELTNAAPTAASATYYAAIVKDAAMRRQVVEAAQRAMQIAADGSISSDALAEVAREAFDNIGADALAAGSDRIGDWIGDYLTSLGEKPRYSPSPWYDLNDLINGFRDGGFYVVAARPSVGKTVIGAQIALHIAAERPVVFVSLEMDRFEIASRLVAQVGQVFLGNLNKHSLGAVEWGQTRAAAERLKGMPIAIVGSDQVSTIPQLKAKVRHLARDFKRTPVVVIDYLQLFTSGGHVESRQVEVAGFSRALKLAAQQWGVPVIALSQLNRGSAARKNQEPALTDLRESGAIEQDADCVLLLHPVKKSGAPDDIKIIVAKNRQGRTGSATLMMQGQFARAVQKAGFSEELNLNERTA